MRDGRYRLATTPTPSCVANLQTLLKHLADVLRVDRPRIGSGRVVLDRVSRNLFEAVGA
jgi:hypothetical protein